MTTEPTLREKVLEAADELMTAEDIIDRIADLLSATGAPAYIRVADDLRGVVREEGPEVMTSGHFDPARYLGQFDKRGEGK